MPSDNLKSVRGMGLKLPVAKGRDQSLNSVVPVFENQATE